MKRRERILYPLLLMLIIVSSCAMLRSVVVVCDHVSHSSQTHVCCHCSEHHTDCDTHTESVEHTCVNGGVELLVYILPEQSHTSLNCSCSGLCLYIELSYDQHLGGDDPSYLYWIRNDIIYDSPIHTKALLRAPPALG